jgi:hypothetical protein
VNTKVKDLSLNKLVWVQSPRVPVNVLAKYLFPRILPTGDEPLETAYTGDAQSEENPAEQ